MSYKIIAFGASNRKESINRKLATHAAGLIKDAEATLLDLNEFEMPIYSIDRENENGIPEQAHLFKQHMKDADGIIISFAEHNGAYSTAFKNIFDWVSRIDQNVWEQKPMFLLATSPGPRGGQTVLEIAVNKFKFMNKNSISSFSLPSFYQNFNQENGITDADMASAFKESLNTFNASLSNVIELTE